MKLQQIFIGIFTFSIILFSIACQQESIESDLAENPETALFIPTQPEGGGGDGEDCCKCNMEVLEFSPVNESAFVMIVPALEGASGSEFCNVPAGGGVPPGASIGDFRAVAFGVEAGDDGSFEVCDVPANFNIFLGNYTPMGQEGTITAKVRVTCGNSEVIYQPITADLSITAASPWDVECFTVEENCKATSACTICPDGWEYDGANCHSGICVPDGSDPFIWNNGMYYHAGPGNSCNSGGWFDGANCYLGHIPPGFDGFVWNNCFYTHANCP